MSFLYNDVPIIPGAYLVNGTNTTTNAMWQIPIFASISSLVGMGYQNVDDIYYVLPGYKIELYENADYNTLSKTINNTN